jgi:hypothetical protein
MKIRPTTEASPGLVKLDHNDEKLLLQAAALARLVIMLRANDHKLEG